jgi:hypothetical protein
MGGSPTAFATPSVHTPALEIPQDVSLRGLGGWQSLSRRGSDGAAPCGDRGCNLLDQATGATVRIPASPPTPSGPGRKATKLGASPFSRRPRSARHSTESTTHYGHGLSQKPRAFSGGAPGRCRT